MTILYHTSVEPKEAICREKAVDVLSKAKVDKGSASWERDRAAGFRELSGSWFQALVNLSVHSVRGIGEVTLLFRIYLPIHSGFLLLVTQITLRNKGYFLSISHKI